MGTLGWTRQEYTRTYFVCKYCQKSYQNSKEFVTHKLRAHLFEMERDYGSAACKAHSSFKTITSSLATNAEIEKTESNKSGISAAPLLASQEIPTGSIKSKSSNESNTQNPLKIFKTEKVLRRSTRSSFSTEASFSGSGVKTEPEFDDHEDAYTGNARRGFESQIFTEQFKCKYCPKEFASQIGASIHENIHTGSKPFKCGSCGKGFVYQSAKARHKRTCYIVGNRVKCHRCNELYSTQDRSSPHYNNCIRKRRGFGGERKVGRGMLRRRGPPPKGQSSSYLLINEDALKSAEKYVSRVEVEGGTRFRCDFCGKVSRDRRNANACVCSHTGDNLFSCKECGMGFNRRCVFLIHVRRVHTGEKPYGCSSCEMTFAWKRLRDTHQDGHEDLEKVFPCRKCGRWFKIKRTRDIHEGPCDK